MPNCLEIANQLVSGDRNADYGHPLEDFSRTAAIWAAILGTSVTAEQVGLCMIAVKLSRHCNKPKLDNLVDVAGYARTLEMIAQKRQEFLNEERDIPAVNIREDRGNGRERNIGVYESVL